VVSVNSVAKEQCNPWFSFCFFFASLWQKRLARTAKKIPQLCGKCFVFHLRAQEKGLANFTRPFFRFNFWDVLFGYHVDGAGAFFALTDVKRYRLAFLKVSVAAHFNFRMMNEKLFAAIIGDNESKTLFAIKPLYFACTHCNSFGPCGPQTKILPLNVN
jgi:hypothetical protein